MRTLARRGMKQLGYAYRNMRMILVDARGHAKDAATGKTIDKKDMDFFLAYRNDLGELLSVLERTLGFLDKHIKIMEGSQ